MDFITEAERVYCAVRTGDLNAGKLWSLKGYTGNSAEHRTHTHNDLTFFHIIYLKHFNLSQVKVGVGKVFSPQIGIMFGGHVKYC